MGMMSATFSSVVSGIVSGVARISMRAGGGILFNLRANKKYAVRVKRTPSPMRLIPHEFIVVSEIKRRRAYRYDIGLCKPNRDLSEATSGGTVLGTLIKTNAPELRKTKSWVRFSRFQFLLWEHLNYHPYRNNLYSIFPIDDELSCWTWTNQAWKSAIRIMLLTPSR